jgi:Ser/Thr protein kinase RdoA (MazF antagonist)
MNRDTLHTVLPAFGFEGNPVNAMPFGDGLINHTWKLEYLNEEYILQRVNHTVFKQPEDIAHNIRVIADYLRSQHPDYFFVVPYKTRNGDEYFYKKDDGYYRLMPFVTGSYTENVVTSVAHAEEAARQFGRFTRQLSNFDVGELKITLPDFHNLSLRYNQFIHALGNGDNNRAQKASAEIKAVQQHIAIKDEFESIKQNPAFKLRVTHHDTKISNVLFREGGNGICVIDLDTVMPGYFISDVGDMMRTYLSPVSEEETDLSKIEIRNDFYNAILRGYCAEMETELTAQEKDHFLYAGKFMIYMQAIRFLTDYLNNDIYYAASYEDHNLLRARNQLMLLQRLIEKENTLNSNYDDEFIAPCK